MTERRLTLFCRSAIFALGLYYAWSFRHVFNPDGVSYLDIADAFRQAAGFGCQGVEIHMRQAEDVDVKLVKRLMADYGLAVPTLGTGMAAGDGLSFAHPDAEVRARTIERVRGHIDFAAAVGSAVTIGSLSGRLGERQIAFEVIAVDMIGRPWQGFDRLL